MTWEQVSAPNKTYEDWIVWEETVDLDSSSSDQSTSAIDFIPYGKDWIIEVDPSATLTSSANVDIDYAYLFGGTYIELATTAGEVLKAGTASRVIVDNSVKGNAPYYKIRFDKDSGLDGLATKSVKVTVSVPPPNGIIY